MKFAIDSQKTAIMEITPKMAKEMLDTSPGNRSLRLWYVDWLAAAMKRGEWRVTSQGIGFDVLGRLRDGHHRLNACIKAGVPFKTVVTFGLPIDAYEVIDTGLTRSYADRLNEDKRVAEVLRLGCTLVTGYSKPTVAQMRPIVASRLRDVAIELIKHCGTCSKYYGSAPMKLAACATIMAGGNKDYVFMQYRALCTLDFDSMSRSARALVRQVDVGTTKARDTRETIARGLRVFDENRKDISRIQVGEGDIKDAVEFVRRVLRNACKDRNCDMGTFAIE